MKCDRRWWNDGRVTTERARETESGGQFCVPRTLYVAEIDLDPPHAMTVWHERPPDTMRIELPDE